MKILWVPPEIKKQKGLKKIGIIIYDLWMIICVIAIYKSSIGDPEGTFMDALGLSLIVILLFNLVPYQIYRLIKKIKEKL